MKKGQMCEGIIEYIDFPNKGRVKVEDQYVCLLYTSSCHLQHNLKNTGRTAENESVDQMISGCYFPTGQDENQDEKAHACN